MKNAKSLQNQTSITFIHIILFNIYTYTINIFIHLKKLI